MNPGWVLLVDPARGDRMWHDVVKTEHHDDGWHLAASCGRELVTDEPGERRVTPPQDEPICHACVQASAAG